MLYVIGITSHNLIKIKFDTMWDGRSLLWDEVSRVKYECSLDEATTIDNYDEAKEILNEIQNRISKIAFDNISIIGQIIDNDKGFNKVEYAKKLKIFKLVPTLVED